jgi:hypothetical protein
MHSDGQQPELPDQHQSWPRQLQMCCMFRVCGLCVCRALICSCCCGAGEWGLVCDTPFDRWQGNVAQQTLP